MRRQIEVDSATGETLDRLAEEYGGDLSEALADLVRTREGVESLLDQIEETQAEPLQRQLSTSEEQFAEGRTVSWEQVKRRNRL